MNKGRGVEQRGLRKALWAVLLPLFCLALSAAAQETSDVASQQASVRAQRVTYFLIDSSGSMRGSDAEARVSEELNRITAENPSAPVSRTYFRARDGAACWAPVNISAAVPASQSVAAAHDFEDDYTPLGAALRAALSAAIAGGRPADIFLVSDQDQTPSCGIDICTVADEMLPQPNVRVRAVPVTGSEARHVDRLGCIDAAQARQETRGGIQPEPRPATSSNLEDWTWREWREWLERWLWLFLFVLLGVFAAVLGFWESRAAVQLENDTREAQSQRRQIESGVTAAEAKLAKIAEKNRNNKELLKDPWFWVYCVLVVLLTCFIVLLIGFIVCPGSPVIFGIRISAAREAAWTVLNSNFATAFAGTWIALLYFLGSQSQRHREARHQLQIATNEGERALELEQKRKRSRVYKEYKDQYEKVATQTFEVPWQGSGNSDTDLSAFRRVVAKAKALAVQNELPEDEQVEKLTEETKRLKGLAPPLIPWSKIWNFQTFVSSLLDSKLVSSTREAPWEDVLDNDVAKQKSAIRTLDSPGAS